MATNNEFKILFAKVKHTQKQIKNKILRFKDDIEKSISEVKRIIENSSHKLISTFFEGRKRKLVTFNRGIDFVGIEKDIKLMCDQFDVSMAHIDGFMTLSALTYKLTNEHNDNVRGGGVGVGRRVPHFLQKLYNMVEKEELNSFVSWNFPNRDSFIIRDVNGFATQVLRMYFSHSNFSSFTRQLNIYGFEKISWEHHEYANEWFQRGRCDLLVNIKRIDKNPLSNRSTIKCSATETFKDQLKTIEEELDNKIICLSNYQEEMKRSIHEFKEIVVNMTNIVNKMILTSNENFENFKKPKVDIADNVTGSVKGQDLDVGGLGGNHMASIDNNSVEAQRYFVDLEIDLKVVGTHVEMEEIIWID